MARKTIAQTLEEQRVLIFNSSKPEIAPLLLAMGIDADYLKLGENIYNTVVNLSATQKKEQQEESLAFDTYQELKGDCKATASKNYKIIKMASRNDKDLQNRLKIYAPKETAIDEWIKQTIELYNLALNELAFLAIIARFGITTETLNQNKADLESLKTLHSEAFSEKGQAQEATRLRNEKMDELEDYCYELKTIATIALAGQPQLLEMLGIVVRS
ncbi:MAG: hypothetical protein JEZ09_09510 [Salinivirgaceae bacterium]|nr:hypothetical protein [Salinivirgaceae bacterium]